MEKNRILTAIILVIAILSSSCKKEVKDKQNEENIKDKNTIQCDSVIYELSEEATNSLLYKIKGKKVSFCNIVCNKKDNEYSFSFSYDDKTFYTKRDTLLIQKTNIYLKLKEKYYPVITEFDNLFSNIPRDRYAINDFNFCFVVINAQGKVVGGFAY